jgi:hypothetical protein
VTIVTPAPSLRVRRPAWGACLRQKIIARRLTVFGDIPQKRDSASNRGRLGFAQVVLSVDDGIVPPALLGLILGSKVDLVFPRLQADVAALAGAQGAQDAEAVATSMARLKQGTDQLAAAVSAARRLLL